MVGVVHETRIIPPGKSGWTFGKHIMIRPNLSPDRRRHLIAHEQAHVEQYDKYGIPNFLFIYLKDYFKNLIRLKNHRKAYLAIPFEIQARAKAAGHLYP